MTQTVYCVAVPDYTQADVDAGVERIFASSPCTAQLNTQTKVLLKPNMLAKHKPQDAVTTHPAVVIAVVTALKKRGVTHITLADSAGGLYNPAMMQGIYQQSGMADVCAQHGVHLYTACKAQERTTKGSLVQRFNLIDPVHEADFIINLPKLKTHVMTGVTGAVKNLFGTVPGLQKAEFHMRFPDKDRFGEMLVDLCECVKPQLHIMDAIIAMEGDGPAGGTPRAVGALLGGENPYAIDLVMCQMAGIGAMHVPYLNAAHKRGLCAQSAKESVVVQGDVALAQPIANFVLPKSYGSIDFAQQTPRAIRWAIPPIEKMIAPRPKINRTACIGCGKCAEICPGHTIVVADKKAKIMPKDCIRCFCCHEVCPIKAIHVTKFSLFHL